MNLTCKCKAGYTCVACKVKRGDYKDWMLVDDGSECADCGAHIGPRATYCHRCLNRRWYQQHRRTA